MKTVIPVVFILLITSCSDPETPKDMSSDVSEEMSGDMAKDAPKDIAEDVTEDISKDASKDIEPDHSPDMLDMEDTSRDLSEDMNVEAPAYRRMCIEEDIQRCQVQQKTQFGDCGEVIGAVFDGQQCVEATGCPNCQGDECPMFDSIESCASSCAQNGWCQLQKMPVLSEPKCTLNRCSEPLVVCIDSNTDPVDQLGPFGRGDAMADCREQDAFGYCRASQIECVREGQWCCNYRRMHNSLNSDELSQACALTLRTDVQQVGCIFIAE